MNRNMRRSIISYLVLFLIIFGILTIIQNNNQDVDTSYTEATFEEDMKDGKIKTVYVQQNAEVPTGTVEIVKKDRSKVRFYVTDVGEFQKLYEKIVDEEKVNPLPPPPPATMALA